MTKSKTSWSEFEQEFDDILLRVRFEEDRRKVVELRDLLVEFIFKSVKEAKAEGRREGIEECMEIINKLREENAQREIDDEYERWLIDNGPETLGEAMREGCDDGLTDAKSAMAKLLNPSE